MKTITLPQTQAAIDMKKCQEFSQKGICQTLGF